MPLLALLVLVVALAAFGYVAYTTKSLLAAGLFLAWLAFMLTFTLEGDRVTF